ncbi:mediator of RNA polymerase II transcription subunit 18 [Trichonephila clavipes]|uniref:Mediator of RNA polymerase II transcription subunit 18 n=1 Tax=Trichonephila inaurata madagascariensis TaxID=2747483 RepID=A0A8X6YQ84_9ARAC|nr:mediator of RNA polymerase II transcription subunit 18 [Trichonephila clavipes]GFY76478.1 mediator of RNA polymerase II transcription subunit 18 [Trichonephila inaurata madagascariensis]
MEPIATSRRNFNFAPQQEFLMQGSIMDTSCEVLLHRLRGLCDNADENPEAFHDYEMVFQIRGPTGTPLVLRARQALDHPEMPWHLRYIGQPEIGDKNRATMIRSCIDVDTSNNVVQFLNELGFRLDYEFVLKGFMFRKGRMKVTVAKVCRLLQQNNPDSIEPVSQSYLVELSVVAPTGQEALADEMKAFSEQLKPLVQLDKFDHRRLQHV